MLQGINTLPQTKANSQNKSAQQNKQKLSFGFIDKIVIKNLDNANKYVLKKAEGVDFEKPIEGAGNAVKNVVADLFYKNKRSITQPNLASNVVAKTNDDNLYLIADRSLGNFMEFFKKSINGKTDEIYKPFNDFFKKDKKSIVAKIGRGLKMNNHVGRAKFSTVFHNAKNSSEESNKAIMDITTDFIKQQPKKYMGETKVDFNV